MPGGRTIGRCEPELWTWSTGPKMINLYRSALVNSFRSGSGWTVKNAQRSSIYTYICMYYERKKTVWPCLTCQIICEIHNWHCRDLFPNSGAVQSQKILILINYIFIYLLCIVQLADSQWPRDRKSLHIQFTHSFIGWGHPNRSIDEWQTRYEYGKVWSWTICPDKSEWQFNSMCNL